MAVDSYNRQIIKTGQIKIPVYYKGEPTIAASSSTLITPFGIDDTKDVYITNVIFYSEDASAYRAFWFRNGLTAGMMDMRIPPLSAAMAQLELGAEGFKIDAGNSFYFCVGASWGAGVKIHIMAFGYQLVEVTA